MRQIQKSLELHLLGHGGEYASRLFFPASRLTKLRIYIFVGFVANGNIPIGVSTAKRCNHA